MIPTVAYDIIRIACYGVLVVGLSIIGMRMARHGARHFGWMLLALATFCGWLMFEAALTSSGVNTRELRSFATPVLVVAALLCAAAIVEVRRFVIMRRQ